jgi:Ser/Thr protein kinase RdoA (MazF antagonist)
VAVTALPAIDSACPSHERAREIALSQKSAGAGELAMAHKLLIKFKNSMSWEAFANNFRQAIKILWDANMVHGDIRIANVMVTNPY